MRKWILPFLIISCALTCPAQDAMKQINHNEVLHWHSSVAEVYDLSMTSGKPIFAFFTGSDWCGWCHKLQNDVFAKPAFVEWANKNVVLLELDFPRKKKMPQELAQQNNQLQQVFRVEAFPTVWMFCMNKDEAEKKINISALGSLGYPPSVELGKEEDSFLNNANKILASCKK